MRPETLKAIEKTVNVLKVCKGVSVGEEKKRMDEYMFCFRNCYNEAETVRHVTNKFPSLAPAGERKFFQVLIALTDEKFGNAYLKDAEDCAFRRAKNNQGEASTSHKCEADCKKRPPTQ